MKPSPNRKRSLQSKQKPANAPPRADVERVLGQLRAGDTGQARIGAKKLVAGFPNSPIAQDVYGIVARKIGDFDGARVAFSKAMRIDPRFLPSVVNMANTLGEVGDHVEASKLFRKALEIEGETARLLVAYSKSLDAAGQVERAQEMVKRALELEPDNLEAAASMGHFATYSGDRDAAAARYAEILEQNPRHANVHRNLTNVKKYQPGDPHIGQMQKLIEDPSITQQDRVHLAFAIGKALDDAQDYDQAFKYFERGNQGYFEQKPYDPDHERKMGVLLRSSFSTPQQPLKVSETANPRPIFVVAPPRSGTSMMEQILTCSDQVHAGGELGFLVQSAFEARAQVRPPDMAMFRNIRQGYLGRLADASGGKPIVIDKQSANNFWVGHILCAMPEAQVIHLRRDPRAVGWSIYRRIFDSPLMSWAYDLPTLGKYLRDYEQLMQFWNRRFPGRVHTVNYEALTEDPEGILQPLITGLGLEWDESFLSFHSAGRTVRTASALQVRKPIYKGSSEQWRTYEAHLGPMIDALELPWD
ncbi:sulfotransferase [Tropicibacter sp. Alg240-R139]|uniref:tetratricopeptide repeat-containing sulfotransferase family protein n=1 Tax=Tropicibacter sp. Alg240-R139 TaxID=2305991 RepID=UPI0013DECA0F|nr:sulfotransferase [Tropicibacter sp. Alg240-R139]